MTVPSNLIPIPISGLPEAPTPSEDMGLVVTYQGTTYRVRAGDLVQVVGVLSSRQINAGTGLTGGGNLSADRTISVAVGGVNSTLMSATGATPGSYGSATLVPTLTVDAAGRVTVIGETPVSGVSLPDGDYGDIVVSGTGTTLTIDTGVVTTAKMGGDVTVAGKALLDDADNTAQRTTLGLGTIATQDANNVAITGGSVTGIVDLTIADGGTGASTATAAFDNLAPTTTAGDTIYFNGTNNARLPIGAAGLVYTVNAGGTAPEWAPGGGGGGLTNWVDGISTVAPNDVVPAASFTAFNAATDVDAVLVAKGTGATLAQVPDGTDVGGDKRGVGATDWQKGRNDSTQVASGEVSTISGGNANKATAYGSAVGGGESNTVTELYGFAAGTFNTVSGESAVAFGSNNIASAYVAVVAGGESNTAGNQYATVSGGLSNSITGLGSNSAIGGGSDNTILGGGTASFIGGGNDNTVDSASGAVVCGGENNYTTGAYSSICGGRNNSGAGIASIILGGESNTTNADRAIAAGHQANDRGAIASFAFSAGAFTTSGDAQRREFILRAETANATPTVLTTTNTAASTDNQIGLIVNSGFDYEGSLIVREDATGDTSSWHFSGTITQGGAGAGSTALLGSPTLTTKGQSAGAATWTFDLTADTTNGALAITVTGQAAHILRWVSRVVTTEVAG